MGKRVSPSAIGAFVVSALAIALAAIVVIGSGKLFQQPVQFVCMFEGDLNGLKVGAPVKFKGVQIGSVSTIRLRLPAGEGTLKPDLKEFLLPVILDLDRTQLESQGAASESLNPAGLDAMIQQGLRAQLATESFLTGMRYVDLSLHPKAPVNLALQPGSSPYREIPTIPTDLEAVQARATQALARLEVIDFQALADSITRAANSIQELANSPSLKATLEEMKGTTAQLNQTVISMRAVFDQANKKMGPLVANLEKTSNETTLTMQQTRATLLQLQYVTDPESPMAVRLADALDGLTTASRQIGELSDYLHRNPSSVVRGRYFSESQR